MKGGERDGESGNETFSQDTMGMIDRESKGEGQGVNEHTGEEHKRSH